MKVLELAHLTIALFSLMVWETWVQGWFSRNNL